MKGKVEHEMTRESSLAGAGVEAHEHPRLSCREMQQNTVGGSLEQ